MDEVRMDLPCTALSIDLETTGCWPGVHKIVAVGVALFQLHPSHQVVEVERRLFQFKVNYPQDFDEITLRDFWHVQGRMDLLAALQKDAKPEEEAIKDFYDFYTEVCYRFPKFFLVTDNPVMDLGFLNLSIATKLGKPPLTYRPVQRCSASSLAPPELRLPWCSELAPSSLDSSSSPMATRTSSTTTLSSESESDDEFSTASVGEEDSSEASDEEAFGESGEEDISADEGTSNHTGAVNEQLLLKANELAQRVQQLQVSQPTSCGTGKRLASFYDDYSAPHFAVDLNSFACGLIGLHLPPFRRAGGSRWASPADFLSFHKPYLVCPYRKTHDPVDDASSNCWHFLQCISILWVNEYTQIHQARKDEQHQQQQHQHQHQHTKSCGGGGKSTSASGGGKPPVYSDADFPTISSANKQQQQQRSPRRGRTPSSSPTSAAKATSPPPRGARPQQQQQQQRQHQGKAGGNNSSVKSVDGVPRRTTRSFSDPPFMDTTSASSSFSASSSSSSLAPPPASPPPAALVLF